MQFLAAANGQSWVSPTGRTRWKKKRSQTSRSSHLESALKWRASKNAKQTTTIADRVLSISRQEILENRHYIKTVAQVVTICAVQDFALQLHKEGRVLDDGGEVIDQDFNCGNRNRGNFLEILGSYSVHDTIVRKKLHGPQNSKYVHHGIQDDLLGILAQIVRNDILDTLTKTKHFALLCDETKDCGKDEQLSWCIRYMAK